MRFGEPCFSHPKIPHFEKERVLDGIIGIIQGKPIYRQQAKKKCPLQDKTHEERTLHLSCLLPTNTLSRDLPFLGSCCLVSCLDLFSCPLDICKDKNDFDNGKEFCQKRKIFFLSCFFAIFDVLSFHIKKKEPDGNNN